jgi:hypothetical protein
MFRRQGRSERWTTLTEDRALLVPVSAGELLDKISILAIKVRRIANPEKRATAAFELDLLSDVRSDRLNETERITGLYKQLVEVNEALWDIEDRIRVKERDGRFDDEFIELARSVYRTNDLRAELKREINAELGSPITEVKEFTSDQPVAPAQAPVKAER